MEKRQISFSPPDITEAEVSAVADALRSGWITTGPRTKEFEKRIAKLCGTDKAVALGSATACLESILRFLGIGAGDEVITSAYTYTASASPAVHVGAALKFIDVAPDSFVQTDIGICGDECSTMLSTFFKELRKKRKLQGQ